MTESAAPAPPRLAMKQISKSFGGVKALQGVTLEARSGEVLAICGENGAGKSTLMKVLAGALTDYEGEILLDGVPVRFQGPRDAEDAGIRIIHQELNLVPELSVAANLFLGREITGPLGLLNTRAMEEAARTLFDRLGTPISPRSRVADLRIGDQQMVEIAKALASDASIVIMDEPTSALSDAEVARLYRVINDLRAAGTAILYISHKMNEVFTLADAVTVLRDGQHVASAPKAEISPEKVIRWMVGREIANFHHDPRPVGGRIRLKVDKLNLASPLGSGRPSLRDLSFHVDAGEVVGIAGLLGAGRTEILESLFGATSSRPSGTITLDDRPALFHDPGAAIAAGVALVTEDRKSLGLFTKMKVSENITIRKLDAMTTGGLVNGKTERQAVVDSIRRLTIKTDGGGAAITSLSGGNQQKCIIARWLLVNPKLLLLDEPTRGIDVGAKAEIYALIRLLAKEGMAVLMTSSELPELLTVADRILVLCEGRLTANLPRDQASEEKIMHAATQFLARAAG